MLAQGQPEVDTMHDADHKLGSSGQTLCHVDALRGQMIRLSPYAGTCVSLQPLYIFCSQQRSLNQRRC